MENTRYRYVPNNVLRDCKFRENRHSERETYFTSGHTLIISDLYVPHLLSDLGEILFKISKNNAVDLLRVS
jgi:hypothetical protein